MNVCKTKKKKRKKRAVVTPHKHFCTYSYKVLTTEHRGNGLAQQS